MSRTLLCGQCWLEWLRKLGTSAQLRQPTLPLMRYVRSSVLWYAVCVVYVHRCVLCMLCVLCTYVLCTVCCVLCMYCMLCVVYVLCIVCCVLCTYVLYAVCCVRMYCMLCVVYVLYAVCCVCIVYCMLCVVYVLCIVCCVLCTYVLYAVCCVCMYCMLCVVYVLYAVCCVCMYCMLCVLFDICCALCPVHIRCTQVHKVQHLQHISSLSTLERRNAEMALFCKQPQQAEAIYLQSNLIFRAIELNINLYNWERWGGRHCLWVCVACIVCVCVHVREMMEGRGREGSVCVCVYIPFLTRALELAVKHKTHVDTVLAFRQKYLKDLNCEESLKKFKQYSQQVSHQPPLLNAHTHTHKRMCTHMHTHTHLLQSNTYFLPYICSIADHR